ncbi:hypothetical protein RN607_00035 [Demequina capsici]|uniref:Uncharacterized protein n=1 Tax=Demequina capsici TaxID=3075620 RepID=A0AA96FDK6_9MICO|nr:hypothetical protein [Demequina sp. PMTSA13]WNM27427.1 hypothetical protein RN607_00035 [Demequina sp. PMTSA13]
MSARAEAASSGPLRGTVTTRGTGPARGSGRIFGSVVALLGRGFTPRAAARELGIREDLADAVAAEAERLGLVVSAGTACGTGCTPGARIACAGCPLAR